MCTIMFEDLHVPTYRIKLLLENWSSSDRMLFLMPPTNWTVNSMLTVHLHNWRVTEMRPQQPMPHFYSAPQCSHCKRCT